MNKFVKALHIASWVLLVPIHIIGILLGLVFVPIALKFDKWPKLLWLWGNDKPNDQPDDVPNVAPTWWLDQVRAKAYPATKFSFSSEGFKYLYIKFLKKYPSFYYFAIRNPFNNRRFIFKDPDAAEVETNWNSEEPMESQPMQDVGQKVAYAWKFSGPFASYRKLELLDNTYYRETWVGWKVGSPVPGLAFTMQYRKGKIGN